MRGFVWRSLIVGLALTAGCKGKKAEPGAGSAAGSAQGGSAAVAGSNAAGSAAVPTASGGAVADLPVVTDCPKSLAGTEKVARTIKKACGPIPVTASLTVEGSLTLEAGVVLKFAADAELSIGYSGPAKLIVQGGDAPDQRVVFTSAGDRAAGVWKGVTLYDGADRSQITGLDIEYAGAAGGAALTLRDAVDVGFTKSSIKHAADLGLSAQGKSTFAAFTGNTFDDIAKVAMDVDPSTVGSLGAGNTFAKDEFVQIRGGHVSGDATWKNIGAPFHVIDHVYVDTASTPVTLTITDATLAFASGIELAIGYNSRGTLKVTGPAVFTGIETAPGSWNGVRVYDAGEATIEGATFSSGGAEYGALTGRTAGKITLGEVTFKDNKVGLWIEDKVVLSAPKVLTFTGNERAAHVWASGFGALTAANVYGDGQIIEIDGGALHADTTWTTQAKATVQILEEVRVDEQHTLTINAGGSYQWKAGASLSIGYSSAGTLKVAGHDGAPVTFGAVPKGDPWNGMMLYGEARNVDVSFLELSDVTGDAGVVAKGSATGKLDHVTCARCAATFAPECKVKVEPTAVTAGAATKVAIKKPEGC